MFILQRFVDIIKIRWEKLIIRDETTHQRAPYFRPADTVALTYHPGKEPLRPEKTWSISYNGTKWTEIETSESFSITYRFPSTTFSNSVQFRVSDPEHQLFSNVLTVGPVLTFSDPHKLSQGLLYNTPQTVGLVLPSGLSFTKDDFQVILNKTKQTVTSFTNDQITFSPSVKGHDIVLQISTTNLKGLGKPYELSINSIPLDIVEKDYPCTIKDGEDFTICSMYLSDKDTGLIPQDLFFGDKISIIITYAGTLPSLSNVSFTQYEEKTLARTITSDDLSSHGPKGDHGYEYVFTLTDVASKFTLSFLNDTTSLKTTDVYQGRNKLTWTPFVSMDVASLKTSPQVETYSIALNTFGKTYSATEWHVQFGDKKIAATFNTSTKVLSFSPNQEELGLVQDTWTTSFQIIHLGGTLKLFSRAYQQLEPIVVHKEPFKPSTVATIKGFKNGITVPMCGANQTDFVRLNTDQNLSIRCNSGDTFYKSSQHYLCKYDANTKENKCWKGYDSQTLSKYSKMSFIPYDFFEKVCQVGISCFPRRL